MIAAQIGQFVAQLRYEDLTPQAIDAAKLRILDTLGAGLAGAQLGLNQLPLLLLESNLEISSIWGERRKASVREATLVNTFATHATYLEDGSRYTGGHPSSVVIPAVIAQAQAMKASGQEMICAVVAGYEIFLRLGQAIYPETVVRGFQSTAVLGAVSAAAAMAKLIALSPQQATYAIAIAANLGVGLKEALKSSGSQPIQVARSAEGGVIAALLAQAGAAGAAEIFEQGFFSAFANAHNMTLVTKDLGVQLLIDQTYLKRHAGCRGNHAPVDAMMAALASQEIDLHSIKQIQVSVDSVTYRAEIHEPVNGEQAQFSIAYSIAAVLCYGDASIFQYTDEKLVDPQIQELMKRIVVSVEPALDRFYPDKRSAKVLVELINGQMLEQAIDNARGEPESPLTLEEVSRKFMALATPKLGDKAKALHDVIINLPEIKDAQALDCLFS
jgi:2-methylcitrate dehydratase PrpD